MGAFPSLMRKGLSPKQMVDIVIGKAYQTLAPSGHANFESFHSSVLDVFNTINSALPGRHFEAPSHQKIKEAFEAFDKLQKEGRVEEKRKVFEDLLKGTKLSEIDNVTMMVGVATPPLSIVAKRAGENVPHLRMIKTVPDALFVPSVTVLSLVSVKLIRKAWHKIGEIQRQDHT